LAKAKRNYRHSETSSKDIPRKKIAKVVAQAPINVGFKPVSYDISKMKSELDPEARRLIIRQRKQDVCMYVDEEGGRALI
jgi:hypothetical protein